MEFKLNNSQQNLFKPRIVVFGVGGAGGNAINNMIKSNLEGVEFVAANTDKQALEFSMAENKIQLGKDITSGLGAGTVPEIGTASAEESIEEISRYLDNTNMLFITAGMGGGTGTGASPIIAKLAKEKGILTVAIITKPFHFEGSARVNIANDGIEELKQYVDTLMVISNQNLFKISNVNTGFRDAFKEADDVLHNSVRSITDLITAPGLINLDFADVKTIVKKMGESVMGIGEAEGENRVNKALESAISNPLLNNSSIKGAKGIIVNISGGSDMTMFEVEEAMSKIQKEVDSTANIILGTALNEKLNGKLKISIVATGISSKDSNDNYGQGLESIRYTEEEIDDEGEEENEEEEEREVDTFDVKGVFDTENDFFNPLESILPPNEEEEEYYETYPEKEEMISQSFKVKKEDEEETEEEFEQDRKETGSLFGSLFKSLSGSRRKEFKDNLFDSKTTKIEIHNDGDIKLNTIDNYNSDLTIKDNITEVPAYLRKKKKKK